MYFLIYPLILIVVYWLLLVWINGGLVRSKEPRMYRGYIPYLGFVTEIAKLGLQGFAEKYSKMNNGIFSTYYLGQRATFITDVTAFPSIYKEKNVGFREVAAKMGQRLFGINRSASLTEQEKEERHAIRHSIVVKHLQGESLNRLSQSYQRLSEKKIDEMLCEDKEYNLNLLSFVRQVVYYASSKALLGTYYF